jgi:hypothetical protein
MVQAPERSRLAEQTSGLLLVASALPVMALVWPQARTALAVAALALARFRLPESRETLEPLATSRAVVAA